MLQKIHRKGTKAGNKNSRKSFLLDWVHRAAAGQPVVTTMSPAPGPGRSPQGAWFLLTTCHMGSPFHAFSLRLNTFGFWVFLSSPKTSQFLFQAWVLTTWLVPSEPLGAQPLNPDLPQTFSLFFYRENCSSGPPQIHLNSNVIWGNQRQRSKQVGPATSMHNNLKNEFKYHFTSFLVHFLVNN